MGIAFTAVEPSPGQKFTIVDSQVSGDCLKAQIHFVLSQIQEGNQFPGTSGLPCDISTLGNPVGNLGTQGDWDMIMRTLIRILFLDGANVSDSGSNSILSNLAAPSG